MTTENTIENIFNNANFLPEKKKINKKSLGHDADENSPNGYAFNFAATFHPKAGEAFHSLGDVMTEEPADGMDLLSSVGLDSENFKVHVVERVMPDVRNPGLYLPAGGHQVVATWGKKQFEMNSDVSAKWADFNWEDVLLPPDEIKNAVIPWGIVAFDNGKRVSMQYLVGDIGNGGIERGNAYLLTLMGSLDGSLASLSKRTVTRIVCANTFAHVANEKSEIGVGRLKRTANAKDRLEVWKESYKNAVEASVEFRNVVDKMMSRKIQNSEKKEFFTALFGKNIEKDNLTDRAKTMLYNAHGDFVNHLENEQPGVEELDTSTVYGWVQGYSSWSLRNKRTSVHGYTGNVDVETVKIRSRFDNVLNTDTQQQPALQYLYQLVA